MAYFFRIAILLMLLAPPALAARDLEAELVGAVTYEPPLKVQALLSEGAKPDAVNTEGVSALALAATRTDKDAVAVLQALLDAGAPIDGVDAKGQSALFYAARAGNRPAVEFLLNRGAQYYLADREGNVPRNVAYMEGHTELGRYMDDFVAGKTAEVMRQYAERSAEMRKQTEAALAQQQQMAADAQPKPVDKAALGGAVRAFARAACVAEYWKRVDALGVPTPPLAEATLAESRAGRLLAQQFSAPEAYLDSIRTPSRTAIARQLAAYPTAAHLRAENIGTEADAARRCDALAAGWEVKRVEENAKGR